jgi:hypothetical protein
VLRVTRKAKWRNGEIETLSFCSSTSKNDIAAFKMSKIFMTKVLPFTSKTDKWGKLL